MNDGTRTLLQSVMAPAVAAALRDWVRGGGGGVLVGDAALSYHARPRVTQDVTLLFLREDDVPASVRGFDHVRPDTFRHGRTGVELSVMTPVAARVSVATAERVVATATRSDGMRVASPSGLVALLLCRPSAQAKADVVALVKTGRVDVTGFALPSDRLTAYATLADDAARDPHPG